MLFRSRGAMCVEIRSLPAALQTVVGIEQCGAGEDSWVWKPVQRAACVRQERQDHRGQAESSQNDAPQTRPLARISGHADVHRRSLAQYGLSVEELKPMLAPYLDQFAPEEEGFA